MPDALLSSGPRPTPINPSFSDRAKLDSNFLSTETSVASSEKLGGSTTTANWKNPKIHQNASSESFGLQTSSTQSVIPTSTAVATSTPAPQDMSASAVNGDMRQNKVSSSTNNLFSSSCQPMRNTPNGESFAKDFIDIFTTLMISLPLKSHRVRFKTYPFTFTTEEALHNMANLRLTQTNRMDDPKNAGRIVTTTTSTSFSIGREMARTIGAQFVQARLVEAAVDGGSASFEKDRSLWQITPKGMHVLHRFANRNGIASNTLSTLLASNLTTMNLIILERDDVTDQILESASLIELIFRRFAGPTPNLFSRLPGSRRDSTGSSNSDHSGGGEQVFDGYTSVVMRDGRRIGDVVYQNCFTGQDALNWLLECCTTVKESEAYHLAATFLKHNLIARCGFEHQRGSREMLDPNAYYVLTERGKRMAGWTRAAGSRTGSQSPPSASRQRKMQSEEDVMSLVASAADNGMVPGSSPSHSTPSMARSRSNDRGVNGTKDTDRTTVRETSTAKLQQILNDPALLTLFREFLRQNFCEENLQFYRETGDFIKSIKSVETIEQVKASLATAFSHYNAFLAQGSPCELNLDHSLRLDLAARMAKAVEDNEEAIRSALAEVVALFERARSQVLRLMASDSVPKFVQTLRYRQIYGEEHLSDHAALITPPPESSRG